MKSSTSTAGEDRGALVPVATGLRLRGAGGRLTGRLIRGGIDQFRSGAEVHVGGPGIVASRQEIETYALYGNKVVIKFRGIDTARQAESFEGLDILMPCNGLVDLPEGAYYIFELVGMRVRTRSGRDLGHVRRVIETGGAPLLVIETPEAGDAERSELMIPAARSICTAIDKAARTITIDPPEGLLEL
ncbi:MAG TPA: ribosome maturation factor RimM [Dongiaceae bacterium]|nr:ribosome maturation factor RimM [Dongiaceae bacterium]